MKKSKELTVKGHFKELRNRMLVCVLSVIVAFGGCFYYAPQIVKYFLQLGAVSDYKMQFAYLYPQEIFMQYLSVALTGAVVVAVPVILFQTIRFIMPAMDSLKEKASLLLFTVAAVVLFVLGIYFSLKIVIPFIVRYFAELSAGVNVESMVSVEKYLGMIKSLLLSFGTVFEIPVVSIVLTKAGLLTPEKMKSIRGIAILVIFIIAAVITPPDVVSQCMIAFPMIGLYQLSIIISGIIVRGKKGEKKTCQSDSEN